MLIVASYFKIFIIIICPVDLSPLNWLVAGPDASLRANRRGLGNRVRGTTSFTKTAEMKRAYGGT